MLAYSINHPKSKIPFSDLLVQELFLVIVLPASITLISSEVYLQVGIT